MSEWVRVAHADEVQAGTPFATTLDDDALVLVRLGDDIVALEDLCTHDGSDISIPSLLTTLAVSTVILAISLCVGLIFKEVSEQNKGPFLVIIRLVAATF